MYYVVFKTRQPGSRFERFDSTKRIYWEAYSEARRLQRQHKDWRVTIVPVE